MEIVAVDRWLLQLLVVDEDESEAVAISCVEFLLSETNAYYRQKCLAQEVVRSVSSRLRDNIFDTVFAAVLDAEEAMVEDRFQPESNPKAEATDRHAVRSVPSKSPEKPVSIRNTFQIKASSSPASRVGSSPDKLRARAGVLLTKKRGKINKAETEKASATTPPVQTIELEGDPDYEKPEIKEWREKCLKTLETSTKKPGFAKLVAIARAFAVPDNRVSMEVGVIAAPAENVVEALTSFPVNMKTNVDSFSSILDPTSEVEDFRSAIEDANTSMVSRRMSRRPSTAIDSTSRGLQPMSTMIHSIAEIPRRQSKRRSQSSSVNDIPLQQQRKSTLLTDSLSRRKLTRKLSSAESVSGNNNGWNSTRNLWSYEQEAGSVTSRTFVADGSEFDATSFPATMAVASGVVLLQGESVVEGPDWVENATTMSRRRFDLQQQLVADALLNAPPERELHSPRCSSLGSPLQFGHSASPLSELHFRDYEEVPPEPIQIPQLSPISTSTLAIPRTHLTSSLSTPSLRVRSPGKAGVSLNNRFGDNSGSNRSISSNSSGTTFLGNLKPRPTTALRAIAVPPKLVSGRARAASAIPGNARSSARMMKSTGTSSAKYLREFPKPKPGVIRVINDQAAGLLSTVEDRQRTAWMS